MQKAPDDGFVLVGRTTHFSDFDDGWIIKTDANGCIDLSCINGVEELDDEDFRLSIYPNPAEEYVSIDLPVLYNSGVFQVYNLQGQLVKSAAITTGGTQTFSISDMPNGIYQLVVYSNNNNKLLGREKLVVAR
ncbi:MAG: T9SS type A sorting domain-containing protein [Sphingobacteriales bacterium JAD_PAG50586_3]|nr:MAG: T9SS type A sorting domain-containing protein [Sphingobacteriales bacterium JAD_PAG50586_3]